MRLRLTAALLLTALLPLHTALAQQATMFLQNPQHSAVYPAAGAPQLGGIKWKFATRGEVYSTPAVLGDSLYVGSTDRNLYALNAATGAQKWVFKTKGRVNSSPAVAGGVVYVGSYDGNFYAVDAATGKQKWVFKTGGERRFAAKHLHGSQPATETMPDPFDFYLSSPAVMDGAVYFGSGDGNVYALDAASGAVKWKFQTGDVVHASPAVSGGTIYVGSWDSYFYALDAASGALKWKYHTGEDHEIANQVGIQSSATVADGTVYFGCRDSNLYALDAQTGEKKWAFNNKGSWVIVSPIVHQGRVYFATSDSGTIHALDVQTGADLFSISQQKWPMFSSPAIAGNTLYIGTHEGKLLAIDLAAQKAVGVFQTGASRQNGPAYTKADGSPNYEAAFGDDFYDEMIVGVHKMLSVGAILSSPVVSGDTVYFGSVDGNVYALR